MKVMKRTFSMLCAASVLMCGAAGFRLPNSAEAANPYLPLWEHVPDGEPHVFEDPDNPGKYRIYIFGSHDILKTEYCGREQVVWSAPVESPSEWRYDGVSFTYYNDSLGEDEVLYAPDVCEVKNADGTKTYYLYPNNMGGQKLVAKSDRPEGPYTVCSDSCQLGGDPAVFVDDDGQAYGYWGFYESACAKIDPEKGTVIGETTSNPIPGRTWSEDYAADDEFRFYEASSMRKIMGKYVYIYSRMTADGEDGLPASNSTLAYAYGDSPLGPFTYGGTIIDSRAKNIGADGAAITALPDGNTHGSVEKVGDRYYVFYHRQTNNNEVCRQGMVEQVNIRLDGERLVIEEAEVTSQGFETDGLDPYKVLGAGAACYLTGAEDAQSWDGSKRPYVFATYDSAADSNNPVVNIRNGAAVGFKYFNFGAGLTDGTRLETALTPLGYDAAVSVRVDSPYDAGKEIAGFKLSASDPRKKNVYTAELTGTNGLTGKHALYFVFSSDSDKKLCKLHDLVFASGDPVLAAGDEEEQYFGKVNRGAWSVSASKYDELADDNAFKAIDGDLGTRWSTGAPMAGGETFTLDMGAEWTFNQIALCSQGDYARGYRVYVSSDGESYERIAEGEGSVDENGYQTVRFPTQNARYFRIVQTSDSTNWWSIFEMSLYNETAEPTPTELPSEDLADFMGTSSDMGNGTFRNPVIYADTPDPDVIRVGDEYYMVSTTMHIAPGVPIYAP